MSIDELRTEAFLMTKWQRHRFLVLIAVVIGISCIMVAVALYLYNTSGAAQVDLSRPGYQSVRSEASRDNVPDSTFSSTGELDDEAFRQFNEMYDRHAKRVVGVDSFDPQALSDESLQLYRDQTSSTNE
ncbi:MAG: hypothetical protein WBP12_05780 [Candidatus Saccharimonas sp.]